METLASGIAAPANAELAPVENAEVDTEASNTEGGESASPATEAGTPAPKDKVQERIDKLTREKYDALRERDRTSYELERLNARLAELEKAPTEQVAPANEFPTLEQFGYDEGKYQAAVAAHFAKIATEQGKTAAQEALNAERARQQAEQADKTWAQKQSEFIKSKPDYLQKVARDPRDGGPVITASMFGVIRESDVGPQVAYYLAENVEQSALIAQMPPIQQAREIGRIEAKLEAAKLPAKPPVSQAPPPVNKVDADAAVIEKSPTEMTDLEFAKWRKKQIAARRNQ
jgi:hypothetical protein